MPRNDSGWHRTSRCKHFGCKVHVPRQGLYCAGHRDLHPQDVAARLILNEYRKYTTARYAAKKQAKACRLCHRKILASGSVHCKSCRRRTSRWNVKAERVRALGRRPGQCAKHGCHNPARPGRSRCYDCWKHERELDSTEERREAILAVEARSKAKISGLPAPRISIMEALDLKRNYLAPILASLKLPKPEALYLDSEVQRTWKGKNVADVWEWSALDFLGGEASFTLLQGPSCSDPLTAAQLDFFTRKVNSLVADREVVMYGTARPELHRIQALQRLLPEAERSSFSVYEPQNSLLPRLFSRNPGDELKERARIYVPDWSLASISKSLNLGYRPDWEWRVHTKDAKFANTPRVQAKSIVDVVYLFNLLDIIGRAKAGFLFNPDMYGPGATITPLSATLTSVSRVEDDSGFHEDLDSENESDYDQKFIGVSAYDTPTFILRERQLTEKHKKITIIPFKPDPASLQVAAGAFATRKKCS